jgi:hypothetical protein
MAPRRNSVVGVNRSVEPKLRLRNATAAKLKKAIAYGGDEVHGPDHGDEPMLVRPRLVSGSDGRRTRDLRRDRPVRGSRGRRQRARGRAVHAATRARAGRCLRLSRTFRAFAARLLPQIAEFATHQRGNDRLPRWWWRSVTSGL